MDICLSEEEDGAIIGPSSPASWKAATIFSTVRALLLIAATRVAVQQGVKT